MPAKIVRKTIMKQNVANKSSPYFFFGRTAVPQDAVAYLSKGFLSDMGILSGRTKQTKHQRKRSWGAHTAWNEGTAQHEGSDTREQTCSVTSASRNPAAQSVARSVLSGKGSGERKGQRTRGIEGQKRQEVFT